MATREPMQIFPINFPDKYFVDRHIIQYSNFMEICQGGPEIASLTVDGKKVGGKEDYFGGPPFFFKDYMFAPRFKTSFMRRYFKIAVISLANLSIEEIGGKEDLALISRVDETTVVYFEDLRNTRLKSVRWK